MLASLVLTGLGPAVWVKTPGYAAPLFPPDPPTLMAMPLAFVATIGRMTGVAVPGAATGVLAAVE